MKRVTVILASTMLLAGAANADANKGKGGGTPPSSTVCTPAADPTLPYTGSCSATNPAGRTCTQEYVNGEPTDYYCTKA